VTTKREQAYNDMVRGLIASVGQLQDAEVARARGILEHMRSEIAARTAETDWQAHAIPQLKAAVTRAIETFERQYRAGHDPALANMFEAGIDMVDAPLAAAGIRVAAPEISRTALEIAQGYSADLIGGLSADAIKQINGEITLGIMGGKSVGDVMQAIGRSLDAEKTRMYNIAARAEAITRTETARVHSAARQARIAAVAGGVTDPAILVTKKWIASGKFYPRENHAALNDVRVPLDQDFPGGLPHPHAPGLPAKEVVNCGCTHVLDTPDWDKLAEDFEPAPISLRAAYIAPPKPKKQRRRPRKYQPAKKLEQALGWIEKNDLAENIELAGGRTWGGRLAKYKALAKANLILAEVDRMQRDLKIKLPKVKRFYITNSRRGAAHSVLPADKAGITFANDWDSRTWENIRAWEQKRGRPWDWIDKESHTAKNVRHEYAHIIDGDVMRRRGLKAASLTRTDEWHDLRRDLARKHKFTALTISDYAKTTGQEYFAEALAQYTSPLYGKERERFPKPLEDFLEGVLNEYRSK